MASASGNSAYDSSDSWNSSEEDVSDSVATELAQSLATFQAKQSQVNVLQQKLQLLTKKLAIANTKEIIFQKQKRITETLKEELRKLKKEEAESKIKVTKLLRQNEKIKLAKELECNTKMHKLKDKHKRELKETNKQIRELTTELRQKDDDISEIQQLKATNVVALTKDLEKEAHLHDVTKQILKSLENEVGDKDQEIKRLTADKLNIKFKYDDSEKKLEEVKKKENDYIEKIFTDQDTITELQNGLHQLGVQFENVAKQNELNEKFNKEKDNEIESLSEQLERKTTNQQNTLAQNEALKKQIAGLKLDRRQQEAILKLDLKTAEDHAKEASRLNDELKRKIEQLETDNLIANKLKDETMKQLIQCRREKSKTKGFQKGIERLKRQRDESRETEKDTKLQLGIQKQQNRQYVDEIYMLEKRTAAFQIRQILSQYDNNPPTEEKKRIVEIAKRAKIIERK